jgi:hypothetical protein
VLGPPAIVGGAGDPAFRPSSWAENLALCGQPDRRVMPQHKHDDRKLPLQLCLVFALPLS